VAVFIRKLGEQLLRSQQTACAAALIVAFLSFLDLPIGWLSSVIIALVTLQQGARAGLMVAAWAILPAAAMLYLGQYAIFINVAVHYLLVLSFALLLRRNNSWINLLQLSALLGMGGVLIVNFFIPEFQVWLVNQLTITMKDYQHVAMFNIQKQSVELWLQYANYFALGMLVLVAGLSNLIILFMARWWQSSVVPVVSVQKELHATRIHYAASLCFILLLAGLYYTSPLITNLLVVAIIPFIFCGLSLLHSYSATKKNGSILLAVMYGLFVFLSPCILFALIVFGWLDSFLNFRKKFILGNEIEESSSI
jgi:hypothetical protein